MPSARNSSSSGGSGSNPSIATSMAQPHDSTVDLAALSTKMCVRQGEALCGSVVVWVVGTPPRVTGLFDLKWVFLGLRNVII